MRPDSFTRRYTDTVVLGLPTTPFRYLFGLYQKTGNRPFVLAPTLPFWRLFFPFARLQRCADRRWGGVLLIELSDLAHRNSDKHITLIPTTKDALIFTNQNREALEASYIIEWNQPNKEINRNDTF